KQSRERAWWQLVAALAVMCLAAASAWGIEAAGDGENFWLAAPVTDSSFILEHRGRWDPPGLIYPLPELARKLLRGGLVGGDGQVWLFYANSSGRFQVQSCISDLSHPAAMGRYGSAELEAVLPEAASVRAVTADSVGPWALLRFENSATLAVV